MKKLYFFVAALFAAVTVNAAVYDFTNITSEADYTIVNATKNASESTDSKIVYDIKAEEQLDMYVNGMEAIHFQIKNSSDKAKAFVVNLGAGKSSIEFGGKNGVIVVAANIGDEIVVSAAAKGGTAGTLTVVDGAVGDEVNMPAKSKGADGADDQGYIWVDATYQAIAASVTLKETTGGIRVKQISVGGATGLQNVEGAAARATKIMENGQIYILRNGEKYTVLGTKVVK